MSTVWHSLRSTKNQINLKIWSSGSSSVPKIRFRITTILKNKRRPLFNHSIFIYIYNKSILNGGYYQPQSRCMDAVHNFVLSNSIFEPGKLYFIFFLSKINTLLNNPTGSVGRPCRDVHRSNRLSRTRLGDY